MKKNTLIRIIFLIVLFLSIIHHVQAAGINGTTIVLNPRTRRERSRLYK